MSDYLTNLIARTLNLGPVVQPRLASWFEPRIARGSVDLSPAPENAREHLSTEQPERQAVPMDSSMPQSFAAQPTATIGIDDEATEHQSSGQTIATVEVQVLRREKELRNDYPAAVPLNADERGRANRSVAPSTRPSGSAIAVQPTQMRNIFPARQNPARRAAVTEEPRAITVTIGRVDVRAIFSQPSAPSVSRAQKSVPMSLDEYLRQQSEGGR